MNLIIFDIPDSPDEIAPWLEEILCRGDLRALVSQLRATHGESDNNVALDEVLGHQKSNVASNGLSSLPRTAITQLLSQPGLLLELQEFVIVEGEAYWKSKFDVGASSEKAATSIIDQIRKPTDPVADSPAGSRAQAGWSRPVVIAFAIAAAFLGIVGGIWMLTDDDNDPINPGHAENQPDQRRSDPDSVSPDNVDPDRDLVDPENGGNAPSTRQLATSGWGWANENSTPTDVTPEEYLLAIAGGAAAWDNKLPKDSASLVQRLTEFRDGCQRLLEMEHSVLDDDDRHWLITYCHVWKSQIEDQLATVELKSFDDGARDAKQLAAGIAELLRERAMGA